MTGHSVLAVTTLIWSLFLLVAVIEVGSIPAVSLNIEHSVDLTVTPFCVVVVIVA